MREWDNASSIQLLVTAPSMPPLSPSAKLTHFALPTHMPCRDRPLPSFHPSPSSPPPSSFPVKMAMNPFCEIAVEEAVRLREKKIATEIIAVSIGPKQSAEILRTALAMGCDRAIHLQTDVRTDQELSPLTVARLLAKVVEAEKPNVVIVGKQSIDGDYGQTGAMLAGLLNWPLASFCAKINVADLTVERETDAGTEIIKLPSLPAVFTADLRLNEPRYATLPNIMKAKKKPMETKNAGDMGVELKSANEVIEVFEPPPRKAGKFVADVDALVDKLKNEAACI